MSSIYILEHTSLLQMMDFVLRIFLSMVCGAVIGYERTKRFKGAGLRTHVIVCCAAALFMIVSKYGFSDLNAAGDAAAAAGVRGADPARIAAQVVSGISFLGAGVIFKNNGSVSGLTTAAGLWATGGIGLAIGSGMIPMGLIVTAAIALFQFLLHKFRLGAEHKPLYQISFTVKESDEFKAAFENKLKEWRSHIIESSMSRKKDGNIAYNVSVRATYKITAEDILGFFNSRSEVQSVSVIMP